MSNETEQRYLLREIENLKQRLERLEIQERGRFIDIPTTTTDTGIIVADGTDGKKIKSTPAKVDASGNIASGLINGALINYTYVSINPASDIYIQLATLPKTTSGTYDGLLMQGLIGTWGSNQKAIFTFYAGARNSNTFIWQINGGTYGNKTYTGVRAYQRSTGEIDICLYAKASTYNVFMCNIYGIGCTIFGNPTTFNPSGTKVFDSSTT